MFRKQIALFLSIFVLISFSAISIANAQTFVPCAPDDVFCQMDCDLDGGVCGQWIGGTAPEDPVCPDGQIEHPTAGTCIYGSDAACRSVFGDAYYNGNEIDGCTCLEGAIYSHETGLCELQNQCPDGQIEHPTAGTCIYGNDAACRSVFGDAYYNGNEIDGCTCLEGAIYSHETGLCEFQNQCPDGQIEHPESGNCIWATDADCEFAFGAAYYDGNSTDGCNCLEETIFNPTTKLCEYPEGCPEGMSKHPESENCIYNSDEMCRTIYGEAYYDGNPTDGCGCIDGATWDGYGCILDVTVEIKVEPGDFTLSADGESTQYITAWTEDAEGNVYEYPMWIENRVPNPIRSGRLDVDTGFKNGSDPYVEATYYAPPINSSEKTEDGDVLQDALYIFVDINGEVKYKVIYATLETQGEGFDVTLKFEKPGLVVKTMNSTFDEGALSGSVYFMNEGEYYDPSAVKVTLDGTLPNAAHTEIHLETYTEDGYFFFENLGETGEKIMDKIELNPDQNSTHYYSKAYEHERKFRQRIAKYGGNSNFTDEYMQIADAYYEILADCDFEDAPMAVNALKINAYNMYFLEYYGRKTDESLSNFSEYMGNVIVDTIGFAQGFINLTTGLYESAGGENTKLAQVVGGWASGKAGDSFYTEKARSLFSGVLNAMRQGLQSDSATTRRSMGHLSEFMGGIEAYFFGEGLNFMSFGTGEIRIKFTNYMKRGYLGNVATIVKRNTIDFDNIPTNIDSNVKRAEQIFISNTNKHNTRNELQYEWDVNTSAVNEFVNVMKPAVKIGLSIYLANPAVANEAVDTAGHAFNALKIAASTNHTYEWYMLYSEDLNDLDRSLSILNTGKDLTAQFYELPEIPKLQTIAKDNSQWTQIAKAEAPQMLVSDALYNVALAIERDDEKALQSALSELEEVRNSNTDANTSNNEVIEGYLGSLDKDQNADAIDLLSTNNDFDIESTLMDLRIIALSNDTEKDYLDEFYEGIDSIAAKEEKIQNQTIELFNQFEDVKIQQASSTSSNKSNVDLNAFSYTLAIISIVILIFGIILSIILFKKKGSISGLISLAITLILSIGTFGYAANEYTPESTPEVESIPTVKPDVEIEPVTKNPLLGKVLNKDYDFTITVGEDLADKFKIISMGISDMEMEDDYAYCMQIDNLEREDSECGEGYLGIFTIEVFNEGQFQIFQDMPYYAEDNIITTKNGLTFYFSHPNGNFPEPAIKVVKMYDEIIESFEFI